MKNFILFITLLAVTVSYSQRDEAYVRSEVSKFAESLQARGISTFFINERFCTGTVEMFTLDDGTRCTSQGTYLESYVFWEEEGQPMIKKFDNCGWFYSLPLDTTEVINYYKEHTTDLQTNKVKRYDSGPIRTGPLLRTEVTNCHRGFHFYDSEGVSSQEYNLLYLKTNRDAPNLNADYNNALKVVQLDKKLDAIIDKMNPQFRRQNL
ncbi:hypothetical protein [Altibacter sp.]|uniref:hypothetical protein n=1 Tax=Altibacter sp. TaxID=2024823 RepID=UPI000C95E417|nr:hypothetical protein [Altibacter sp.]MAP53439.1 hypothetical protein [Altibacter sp.]|tara:strand:- start:48 stop:671 length:624 start_codon:yes stop_codon:yes gene_type:complete